MNKEKIVNRNQVLPIKVGVDYLGFFFMLAIIAYAVYKKYPLNALLVIEFIVLLVAFLLFFFVIGIKNYKRIAEEEAKSSTLSCLDCIRKKMKDSIRDHGLLHLKDLLDIEGKLSLSSNPKACKVLIYTSDLATENDAEKEVDNNINKGVQYVVLYFSNTCNQQEYERIKRLYGENNLVDLSNKTEYKESIDGQLAVTLGFDITIYQNAGNMIDGYFAVDFVPKNRPIRSFHNPHCKEQCNYGKGTDAFYKKLSYNCTKYLYEEIVKIHGDYMKQQERG